MTHIDMSELMPGMSSHGYSITITFSTIKQFDIIWYFSSTLEVN